MAPQHDFILDNQTGAQFRADLNNALEAMVGHSSGPTAPTTTYAYQYWADTTDNVLKQRDASNAAWIVLRSLSADDESIASLTWTLTANGTTDYIFAGPGFAGTETDPTIYVVRGQTYKFTNSMGAHPFQIQSTQGISGTAYNDGITNNGVSNGTLTWLVRMDAPSTLYYQCTSHADMNGTIYVLDEGSTVASIDDLSDVDTSTVAPTDGQALIWDNTAQKWEPGTVSGGGAVTSVNTQTGAVSLGIEDLDDFELNTAPGSAAFTTEVTGTPSAEGEWKRLNNSGGSYFIWAAIGAAHSIMLQLQVNDSVTFDYGGGQTETHLVQTAPTAGSTDYYIRVNTPGFSGNSTGTVTITSSRFSSTSVALANNDILQYVSADSKFKPAQAAGVRTLLGIDEYADDTAAGTGGLSSGELYYNTTSSSYVLKS